MLTIRLARVGKKNHAMFRVVVMDHKRATDARPVERLGYYNPHSEEKPFEVDKERVEYWLKNGAQTTTTVASFLKKLDLDVPIRIRKKKSSKTVVPEKKEEEATEAPKEAPAKEDSEAAPKKEEAAEAKEKKEETLKKEEPKKEEKSDSKPKEKEVKKESDKADEKK